jgi:hypothetical protein
MTEEVMVTVQLSRMKELRALLMRIGQPNIPFVGDFQQMQTRAIHQMQDLTEQAVMMLDEMLPAMCRDNGV